jgi:magnesium-transporting ATPase (P-type)
MITGDNPLTAVHVARDVEIVDRDALILDLKENPAHDRGNNLSLFPETCAQPLSRPRVEDRGRD